MSPPPWPKKYIGLTNPTPARRGKQDVASTVAADGSACRMLGKSRPLHIVVFLILSEMSIIDLICER